MADNETTGTGRPNWTALDNKSGLDPLGMQTTSVALYQSLLPGISNVTLRVRYYGFYVWLARHYSKVIRDTSVDEWCRFVRRAEALYALIAQDCDDAGGVAGSRWAKRTLAAESRSGIRFSRYTDRQPGQSQYLKQKFGAFGAAYGSQLEEIGLLKYLDKHEIPVPTSDTGERLAKAFATAAGRACNLFLAAVKSGVVQRSELKRMARMRPSAIEEDSVERQLYEDILFGRVNASDDGATPRSQTLRLVLRTAENLGYWPDRWEVRWVLYSAHGNTGKRLPAVPEAEEAHAFAWKVYHANDMLQVCYGALLKYLLDVLGGSPSGMSMGRLLSAIVPRITAELGEDVLTWQHLVDSIEMAKNAWSDGPAAEWMLQNAITARASDVALSTSECAANALRLLAVLYARFIDQLERMQSELPVLSRSPYLPSIVSELNYFKARAGESISDILNRLLRERIIERHLWVAIQKLRSQGDYTFLLETDDGKVRVRQKDSPSFTNPRLAPAISFLGDIYLVDDSGLTAAGKKILEAA
ncbi:hypothetical protein P5W98_14290 [Paraburkholderia sp. A1BS-2L]|uniref:hypothetical protein n=1 Tax=Paraburkholderia sp. A1BS-2L TaxID=3028373 RepID=UPI003DA9B877